MDREAPGWETLQALLSLSEQDMEATALAETAGDPREGAFSSTFLPSTPSSSTAKRWIIKACAGKDACGYLWFLLYLPCVEEAELTGPAEQHGRPGWTLPDRTFYREPAGSDLFPSIAGEDRSELSLGKPAQCSFRSLGPHMSNREQLQVRSGCPPGPAVLPVAWSSTYPDVLANLQFRLLHAPQTTLLGPQTAFRLTTEPLGRSCPRT